MSTERSLKEGEAHLPLLPSFSRPLALLERLAGAITSAASAIGTIWIVALMILINTDVVGRWLFHAPLPGTPELVTLSIVGIVFLQLPDAARRRSLTRSETLLDFVLRRFPRFGETLGALYELVGTVLFSVLASATFPQVLKAWARSEFIGNPGLLTVPTSPLLGLIVFGSAMLAVQFAINACRALQRAFRRDPDVR